MKKSIILSIAAFSTFNLHAQTENSELDSLKAELKGLKETVTTLKNLKVTGWIQAQYQYIETKGAKNVEGGDFLTNSNNRFMIRRGRVKFTYTNKAADFVLQLNATERGVNLVDIYTKMTDPWTKSFNLYVGQMNRPFGFEIEQSSQWRETPERSRFTQVLLPNERDLGAKISFLPPKGKKLYGFRVDGGFYNGQGIIVPGTTPTVAWVNDYDSFKDFIGKMRYDRTVKNEKLTYGLGLSHYNGGMIYQDNRIYNSMITDTSGIKSWQLADSTNGAAFGKHKAPRVYFGGDFQLKATTKLGVSALRFEYITGTQPGLIGSTRSIAILPTAAYSMYVRSFDAAYVYFVHRFGKTKHEMVMKYDWYDPNTKIKGNEIKLGSGMTDAELKYTTYGIGYLYYATDNIKLMLNYNHVVNETSAGISGFNKDLKDDVLTVRLQYRF